MTRSYRYAHVVPAIVGIAGIAAVTMADAQVPAPTLLADQKASSNGEASVGGVRLPIPTGFAAASERIVRVDEDVARLVRYERTDGRNVGLGGEHVSVLTGADGRLKGFTRMEAQLAKGPLPSDEEARATAMAFLQTYAPDLVAEHEVHWVKPHGETIKTNEGPVEVIGMKVKMQNRADGRWMWVIVGPRNEVITFERDIVWITMPGHRGTEMWLHDAWLAEHAEGT